MFKKKLKVSTATHFKGSMGLSLCEVENVGKKPIKLATQARAVTCENCLSLGSFSSKVLTAPPRITPAIHLSRDGSAWCEVVKSGDDVTPAIAKVDCEDCLVYFRRRLGRPHGTYVSRRTSR